MSKAVSVDLRVRVLAAVATGASHRQAAERFGVSRWKAREREQVDPRPKTLGGERRSGRIDSHHDAVMAALGPQRDVTIEEDRRSLEGLGLFFGFGTIQRCFVRASCGKRHCKQHLHRVPERCSWPDPGRSC
jgi:hypothetical protein